MWHFPCSLCNVSPTSLHHSHPKLHWSVQHRLHVGWNAWGPLWIKYQQTWSWQIAYYLLLSAAMDFILCRLRWMNLSVMFLGLRVFMPLVCFPQGETEILPLLFPLPPPWGWSTEFIAMPLTTGLLPNHLLAPAFPSLRLRCCWLDSTPIVAVHLASTERCSPLGSLMTAYALSPDPVTQNSKSIQHVMMMNARHARASLK